MCGTHISAKRRYFRTSCKVVVISPNIPINSFRQPSTPFLFHCWIFWAEFEKQIFFLSLGNLEAIVGLQDCACRCEKIHFAYTKKYKGVRLNPLKLWPYIFLFSFPEFLMRTEFCWCAVHFNSTLESGSSTRERIEMQREDPFTCIHSGRRENVIPS